MAEPVWVEVDAILALHARSLALHGGAAGIRDRGLLDSALQRPRNLHHCEGVTDLIELAAWHAASISANHPFNDGNKRAAFLAMALFLRLNGLRLTASQVDAARTVFDLAAGALDAAGLAAWLRVNHAPAPVA
ncbi:type II toxin-antitoxin system death-on-curing family toxin [Phenylobacterium sp.]|uniref:type II toxin-antitoxin system death-on-curing family toxin n=1 Tax=Phenylobacterium sp. TaxID=1871053 RepID=UPI00391DDF2E